MQTLSDVRIEMAEFPGGVRLARVSGELDAIGAPALAEYASRLVVGGPFVLDLNEVTFLGSAGLEVLLDLEDLAAREHVRWALVGSPRPVARPLQVTGLGARLPMQATVGAALEMLSAARHPAPL
ncbi:STAS domain-containing protein [Amycolatopsis sp.]|uniref:STAS domain-containing protein n=1 Tax=Amycolatopsis sp. TaxID=37632 RepID=UPI002C7E70F5|nr:STAS domain-containing protein [Amycolatopsis sp.]HVV10337.1 STAS domain-containing protein [Amycolatopsis sp.]